MSRRSRSRDVAISLFSFQDIITSVTAIMILLVLILTLELITRAATKGVAAEDRRVAADLRRSLLEREQELLKVQQRAGDAQDSAREAAGYSLKTITRRLAAAQRQEQTLHDEIERLEMQMTRADAARREAESRLTTAQAADHDSGHDRAQETELLARTMEEANERERVRQAAEAKTARAVGTGARTLLFNPPPDEGLEPLLVEVSEQGISTAATRAAPSRTFPWALLGGPSQAFGAWLADHDTSREYVVIILRPSGIDRYDAVRETVTAAGFALGTELIGEGMDVVMGPP